MLSAIIESIGFCMFIFGAAGCFGDNIILSGMVFLAGGFILLTAAKEDGKIRRKRRHGNRRKSLRSVRRFY